MISKMKYPLLLFRFKYLYPLLLFRIKFPVQNVKGKKRKADEEEEKNEDDKTLIVEPHVIPNRGPYPYNQPKR